MEENMSELTNQEAMRTAAKSTIGDKSDVLTQSDAHDCAGWLEHF
jgi:hypothetical protein